jgi:hypothetical protein
MDDTLVRRHLSIAERHIAEAEAHLRRQREIIARLESKGLGKSGTAGIARDLLKQMETSLRLHVAERRRLRKQLAAQDADQDDSRRGSLQLASGPDKIIRNPPF